jgi:hypothetical protein
MTGEPDGGLRLRLFIDGQLHDERWLTASLHHDGIARETALMHRAAVDEAEANGLTWLIEVFDPDVPADSAYLRFGTDTAGMIAPMRWLADGELS